MNEPGDRQQPSGGWAPPPRPERGDREQGDVEPAAPEPGVAAGSGLEPPSASNAVPPEAPRSPETSPESAQQSPKRRRTVVYAVAAIVVIIAVGAVVLLVMGGDDSTTIATEQGEIPNADEVLQTATDEFLAAADSAGAVAGDDAGCFWMLTQGGPDGGDRFARSVVCGPARFVAGGDWVVAPIDTTASTEDGTNVLVPFARAEFADGDDLGIGAETDSVEFVGIDGAEPKAPESELGEPDSESGAFIADGRLLDAPDELIAAGVELISKPTGNVPLNVHPDASCWIPDGPLDDDGGDGTVGQLVCGPVLSLRDNPKRPWKVLEYALAPGDGPWAATGDPETVHVVDSAPLPTGAGLFHPDGLEPPATDDFGLPDPLPVGEHYVAMGSAASLADVPLAPLAVSAVRTPDFTVDIGGHAIVDRIGEGRSAIIAPEGYQLLVFKYLATLIEDPEYDDYLDESSTAVVLAVGDDERTLEFGELASVDPDFDPEYDAGYVYDTGGEQYTIVAAVPTDAADVELEVQNRGVAQRISLLTGEATGLAPGMDRHDREIQLTERFDVTLTAPDASRAEYPPDKAGFFRGTVNRATLSMWDDDRAWAPDGTIFLTADLSDINIDSGDAEWDVGINWASTVTLVLPDGKVLKPLDVPSDLDEYQPDDFRFAVPLDAKRATLRIVPTGELDYYDGDAYALSATGTKEIPITLR